MSEKPISEDVAQHSVDVDAAESVDSLKIGLRKKLDHAKKAALAAFSITVGAIISGAPLIAAAVLVASVVLCVGLVAYAIKRAL